MNLMALIPLAVEGEPAALDLSGIVTAVGGLMSSGDVTTIITSIIGACGGLFVVWFAARKITSAVQHTIRTGTVRF